jgi:hypothetical protein
MSVMFLDLGDEIGPIGDGFFNDLLRSHVYSPGDSLDSIHLVWLSKSPRGSGFGYLSQKSHQSRSNLSMQLLRQSNRYRNLY